VNVSGRVSNGNGFGFILAGMKLYNYCRSSASFRVRIALNLKGLPFEYLPVHLVRGEQLQDAHRARSPDALVPVLEVDGHTLSQSMAIIEYLEDTRPTPPLLPASALGRAQVRALAQTIACEIHPLNNLRVLKYLTGTLQCDEDEKTTWYRHWVRQGLLAFERQLDALDAQGLRPSAFCYGDAPTLADCLLVPQIFNARRFDTDLSGLPKTMAAFEACMALPAFDAAQPSRCPDFTP
jgi:maleylacetoacetate isomerase